MSAIPTNQAAQYKRLRSYLNSFFKGPSVDAVLNALAGGPASYLINNINAVNNQLYISTASGQYLDAVLSQYGIARPPAVGLDDNDFRAIGLQVKTRKQVRDLMNNLLGILFGAEFVRASVESSTIEPYDLTDGDTLIFNLDNKKTVTVTFNTADFENINAATAQEIADVISESLSTQGILGSAIANNIGNGNFVEILSNTIGPASSVTVLGGSAQNTLQFPAKIPAGGSAFTQWTLSSGNEGTIRFTWSAGNDPNLGRVSIGNYVIINGGGFASSDNEGSFTIINVAGGPVGSAYFEIENPTGTFGIVTQGTNNAVLFYNPVKQTLLNQQSYAAIYMVSSNTLQVFLPATTRVVRRSRIGSAHLHDPSNVVYTFNAQPNPGDVFQITTLVSLTAVASSPVPGASFLIGSSIEQTISNMVVSMQSIPGLTAVLNTSIKTDGFYGGLNFTVWQDDPTLILVGTYTGSANIVPSGPQGNPISEVTNQLGPYMYDTTQPFTLGYVNTTLAQELDATKSKVFQVADATKFPTSGGYLVFGYGTQNQEGPVPYIAVTSDDTLLISPTYTLKNAFPEGASVSLAYNEPLNLPSDGSDYAFYITDVVAGRTYAQDLIESVVAAGINVVFTILYPGDIGLGKWGTPYSEITYVYGP